MRADTRIQWRVAVLWIHAEMEIGRNQNALLSNNPVRSRDVRAGRNIRGIYKGAFGEFALRFTNVFVRRAGRWQLVTHQSTEVRKKVA